MRPKIADAVLAELIIERCRNLNEWGLSLSVQNLKTLPGSWDRLIRIRNELIRDGLVIPLAENLGHKIHRQAGLDPRDQEYEPDPTLEEQRAIESRIEAIRQTKTPQPLVFRVYRDPITIYVRAKQKP